MRTGQIFLVAGLLSTSAAAFAKPGIPSYPMQADDRARLSGAKDVEVETAIEQAVTPSQRDERSIRDRMSPVRDQGSRGTCSAFAAAALFEFALGPGYDLSEQCLVAFGSGQDGGWVSARASDAIRSGLFLESRCRYSTSNRSAPAGLNRNQPDIAFDSNVFYLGRPSMRSLELVKQQINRGAPVGLSVWVSTNDWFNDDHVIRHPSDRDNICKGSNSCGGHAIVITGYNDYEQTLQIKNSWGTNWKDNGYGYITYDYFLKNYMSGQANELVTVQ
jgi:C1A family cysteine protease